MTFAADVLKICGLAMAAALVPLAAQAGDAPGRAKAQTCFACHGPDGNSATPEVPALAGQPSAYIATQLHLFRDGKRQDAQMAPMTVNLTDADIADLAAFFSQVRPAPPAQPPDPTAAAAATPLLAHGHCTACHGESLSGVGQAPRLAGQQRAYLAWQLRALRDGKRGADAAMRAAVKPLSNKDINLLATYVSRLPPA